MDSKIGPDDPPPPPPLATPLSSCIYPQYWTRSFRDGAMPTGIISISMIKKKLPHILTKDCIAFEKRLLIHVT